MSNEFAKSLLLTVGIWPQ